MKSIAGSIVVLGACWLVGVAAQLERGASTQPGLFVVGAIVGVFGLIVVFSGTRDH